MKTVQKNNQSKKAAKTHKPSRPSLFKSLVAIRTDGVVSPLADGANFFLHLVAHTFAAHKLLPRDYPGLNNRFVRLSLARLLRTAWGNVRLSKEGLPQAILFFVVIGLMAFGVVCGVLVLMSFFMGSAFASTGVYPEPIGIFDPAPNDVAQQWLDFLFAGDKINGGSLPTFDANSFVPLWFTKEALIKAFALYSDAILVIAASVLLYHIVNMVLKTAHLGGPMGDASQQIWAPIRLVMAIGLLVPINGGLNSGQYIVIKTASLGSGLASTTWRVFLEHLHGDNESPIPAVPLVSELGAKLLLAYVCTVNYNARLDKMYQDLGSGHQLLLESKIGINESSGLPTKRVDATINGRVGVKFSFSSKNGLGGEDTCGAFFIPNRPEKLNKYDPNFDLAPEARDAQARALLDAAADFYVGYGAPAKEIYKLMRSVDAKDGMADTKTPTLTAEGLKAIARYQKNVKERLEAIYSQKKPERAVAEIVKELSQYGWAFAGTFLSTIERMQAMRTAGVRAGLPSVLPPKELTGNGFDVGVVKQPWINNEGRTRDSVSEVRAAVSQDLEAFASLIRTSWTPGTTYGAIDTAEAQCAGMIGLTPSGSGAGGEDYFAKVMGTVTGAIDDAIHALLVVADHIATWSGVWTATEGAKECGANSASPGMKTFRLGLDFTKNAMVLQELIKFGHANIDTGLRLVAAGATLIIGGKAIGVASSLAAASTFIGGIVGMIVNSVGALGVWAGILMELFASAFLMFGFMFAFVLPLIPFTRYFFAVVVWLGEVIESVIAIPVVALAHLNPEGEGFIAEQAKVAYYYCFSIFLRPIMTLFGLIVGLLLFTIAAYFLTFAYGFAVAASGGTAYGDEILAKFVYTFLYTFMMYVCANKSFEMITHLPNGAVSWMKAPSPKPPALGDVGDLEKYEAIVGGLAIDKGVDGVKNVSGKIGNKLDSIKPQGGGGGSISP